MTYLQSNNHIYYLNRNAITISPDTTIMTISGLTVILIPANNLSIHSNIINYISMPRCTLPITTNYSINNVNDTNTLNLFDNYISQALKIILNIPPLTPQSTITYPMVSIPMITAHQTALSELYGKD